MDQFGSDADADAYVEAIATDWRTAELTSVDQALCRFAEKLTKTPAGMNQDDVQELRGAGLPDPAIHDASQVISYFNYINRVADAIHVDLDPGMPPYPE